MTVEKHTHVGGDIVGGKIPDLYLEPAVLQLGSKKSSVALQGGKMVKVELARETALQVGNSAYMFPYYGGIQVDCGGIYSISASAYISGAAGQTGAGVYVFKTDNARYWGDGTKEIMGTLQSRNGISGSVACASKIVKLDSADVIYLAARSVGADAVCNASNMMTFLWIQRLQKF